MSIKRDQLAKKYCRDVPYGEWDNPYEVCFKAGFDAAIKVVSEQNGETRLKEKCEVYENALKHIAFGALPNGDYAEGAVCEYAQEALKE